MLVVMLLDVVEPAGAVAQHNVAGISQQMLTRTLRGLERDGIVTRTTLPPSPPQVEYSLTALGRSMSKPVLAFGEWSAPISRNSTPPAAGSMSAAERQSCPMP